MTSFGLTKFVDLPFPPSINYAQFLIYHPQLDPIPSGFQERVYRDEKQPHLFHDIDEPL